MAKPNFLTNEENPSEPMGEAPKDEKIEPYHVEQGFNHMMEAEKVKQNPSLLKKVQEHAEKHGQALSAIKSLSTEPMKPKSTNDLRALRNKMSLSKRGMS